MTDDSEEPRVRDDTVDAEETHKDDASDTDQEKYQFDDEEGLEVSYCSIFSTDYL
jgi:hypothetical protein